MTGFDEAWIGRSGEQGRNKQRRGAVRYDEETNGRSGVARHANDSMGMEWHGRRGMECPRWARRGEGLQGRTGMVATGAER